MFDTKFRYVVDEEKEYDLALARDDHWFNSKKRLLIVFQHVPTASLKDKELLSKGLVKDTVVNLIKAAREQVRDYDGSPSGFAYAAVNFNAYRHLHMKGPARAECEADFADRVAKLTAKLKATHVLVLGDVAAKNMLPQVENIEFKRGWIHKYQGLPCVTTLELSKLLEKNGHLSTLLGFVVRHTRNLMLGHNPHDLKGHINKPSYISSLKKFDKMMDVLESLGPTDVVATDTETKDLSVLSNEIYTIQFATSKNPNKGYVVPLSHPLTHFKPKAIQYMRERLAQWFARKDGPELVTFNGMFDLRVIRKYFDLPILYHTVWEITAGEHLLDENASELHNVGPAMGGLAAILCSYGNDHYFRAKFSKAERITTGTTDPSDDNFLEYASYDVTSILAIRQEQMLRAAKIDHNGKPYRKAFELHVRYVMSDTVHQLSHLKSDGSLVDRTYLHYLLGADSPLRKEIAAAAAKLKGNKNAIEANRALLKSSGMKAGSLFGSTAERWILKLSKASHKAALFFDQMGLEPVSETKSGEPAIDKVFIKAYKSEYEEAAILDEWSGLTKLLSTYVRGWNRHMNKDADSTKDSYLRPDYAFWNVSTGRLGSRNPSLQTIPTRSKIAKIIKRMFVAPRGHLLIRFDYSAHEIRMWSVLAGDKVLANAFKAGQALRQQWIQDPSPEIAKELKTKGDLHIQNVYRFFNKWVDKSDPLRDSIKQVVFGTLYGKSAKTLGEDIRKNDIDTIRAKMRAEGLGKADLKALQAELKEVQAKDYEKYAQSIIDKMFGEFKEGAKQVNTMKKYAAEKGYVWSPLGRRRHLWSVLTGHRSIISKQVRRGSNAPIQGAASEVGLKAARGVSLSYYNEVDRFTKFYRDTVRSNMSKAARKYEVRLQSNRVVHDALYYAVPYHMVIPFMHLLQWEATYGVAQRVEKELGLKFTVEPEIEIEFGARDDQTYKWDWSMPNLADCIDRAVDDAAEFGLLSGSAAEVRAQIWAPYEDPKQVKYLQRHYPLLGVPDLKTQINNRHKDLMAKVDEPRRKKIKQDLKEWKNLVSMS